MTVINYTGNAPTVAQVDTFTPGGTIAAGNTFTVTINGKSITYTATGTTVAGVTAGLQALLAAASYPEFLEITWADATTAITATAKVAGRPHVISVSKAQGAGGTDTHTFGKTATTANSGPSDVNVTSNYSGGALPSNGDTLNCDGLDVPLLYNLDAITATGITVNFTSWRGAIGLSEWNAAGYLEYRPTSLVIPAIAVNYAGSGSLAKFDVSDPGAACTFTITAPSSQSSESGFSAIQIKGGTSSHKLSILVNKGNVDVAMHAGEAAHIGTFVCGYQTSPATDAKVRLGSGVVFEDDAYTALGGQVESNSDVGSITVYANATVKMAAGTTDTLVTNLGGTFIYASPDTPVTKYIGYSGSKLDLRSRTTAVVFTDMDLYAGAAILGGEGLFSTTNPISLPGCGLADVSLPKDKNISVDIASL